MKVGSREKSKLTPEMQKLLLFQSIGAEGRSTLAAAGITRNTDETYEAVIAFLRKHYCRTESLYVRTHKYVTVKQLAGEDYSSYLLRIEKCSQSLDFFDSKSNSTKQALQKARN